MICPKCGNSLPEGSKFCLHCGSPMETQPEFTEEKSTAESSPEVTAEPAGGFSDDDYKTVAVTDDRYEAGSFTGNNETGGETNNSFIDFRSDSYKSGERKTYDSADNEPYRGAYNERQNSGYGDYGSGYYGGSKPDDRKKKRLIIIAAGAAVAVIGIVIAVICVINCNGNKDKKSNPTPTPTPTPTATAPDPTEAPTAAPTSAPQNYGELIQGTWYGTGDDFAEQLEISSNQIASTLYSTADDSTTNATYDYYIGSDNSLNITVNGQTASCRFTEISDTDSLADGESPLSGNQWFVNEEYLVVNNIVYEKQDSYYKYY